MWMGLQSCKPLRENTLRDRFQSHSLLLCCLIRIGIKIQQGEFVGRRFGRCRFGRRRFGSRRGGLCLLLFVVGIPAATTPSSSSAVIISSLLIIVAVVLAIGVSTLIVCVTIPSLVALLLVVIVRAGCRRFIVLVLGCLVFLSFVAPPGLAITGSSRPKNIRAASRSFAALIGQGLASWSQLEARSLGRRLAGFSTTIIVATKIATSAIVVAEAIILIVVIIVAIAKACRLAIVTVSLSGCVHLNLTTR
mmetsp:Transcript_1945/g.4106  ORF Transcript_1945/g.4106 Transcript_1945/m.4106 type:complete len:249 (-) Transcript_1945:666-1412(-)